MQAAWGYSTPNIREHSTERAQAASELQLDQHLRADELRTTPATAPEAVIRSFHPVEGSYREREISPLIENRTKKKHCEYHDFSDERGEFSLTTSPPSPSSLLFLFTSRLSSRSPSLMCIWRLQTQYPRARDAYILYKLYINSSINRLVMFHYFEHRSISCTAAESELRAILE